MVEAVKHGTDTRMAEAARRLIEGDMADAEAGRVSRTIFLAQRKHDAQLQRCLFAAAMKESIGVVALQYSGAPGSVPRANVALIEAGEIMEVRNCVLWSEDDGPVLLVPLAASADWHFTVGPEGLERRPGRPASVLGQGISRARFRLERQARGLRDDDLGPGLAVFEPARAA